MPHAWNWRSTNKKQKHNLCCVEILSIWSHVWQNSSAYFYVGNPLLLITLSVRPFVRPKMFVPKCLSQKCSSKTCSSQDFKSEIYMRRVCSPFSSWCHKFFTILLVYLTITKSWYNSFVKTLWNLLLSNEHHSNYKWCKHL